MSFINQGKAGFIFGNVFVNGAKTGRPAFKDMSQTRGYPGWSGPPKSCSYTLNVGDSGADVYGYLSGSYGTMTPDTNVEGDVIYEFTVDATGKVVNSYGLTGDEFPTDGVVAFEPIIAEDITVLMQWNETETAYIGQSTELYDHFSARVGEDVCIAGITTSDIAFLGASYHRSDFHLSQRTFGTPPATATHALAIWSPDKDGTLTEFAVNEPVWNGARVASVVGPEMVPNGDFETNVDGFVAVDPVQLSIQHNIDRADVVGTLATESTTWALISPSLNIDVGKTYKAYAEFTQEADQTAGRVYVGTANNGGQYLNEATLVGALKVVDIEFIATTTTVTISFRCRLTLDQVSFADRLSIKEVLSVYYADDGAGTLLPEQPWLALNGFTDAGGLTPSADVVYTYAAANHDDAGMVYELDVDLVGDQAVMSIGGVDVLSTIGGNLTFSDGTNSCTVAAADGKQHVKAEYSAGGMVLTVSDIGGANPVTDSSAYDGTLGAGDIVIGCTHRELIRRKPAVVV